MAVTAVKPAPVAMAVAVVSLGVAEAMVGPAVMEVWVELAQARARRVSAEPAAMAVLGWMARWVSPVRRAILLSVTAAMVALAAMVEMAATQVLLVSVRSWALMVCPAWVAPVA